MIDKVFCRVEECNTHRAHPARDRLSWKPPRRDKQLNADEWAAAMHLVMCAITKELPPPDRLPKCLRNPPKQQPESVGRKPPKIIDGVCTNGAGRGDGEEPSCLKDMKRARKQFRDEEMKADAFLSILQVRGWCIFSAYLDVIRVRSVLLKTKSSFCRGVEFGPFGRKAPLPGSRWPLESNPQPHAVALEVFGENQLKGVWPKLLEALPPARAEALARLARGNLETLGQAAECDALPRERLIPPR